MSVSRVVAITGCDSGLGWAIAARLAKEGFITVAGMHKGTDTAAAKALRKLRAHTCPLDVTKIDSVKEFREYVISVLKENPKYKFHAVVNNAGVMTIANYEWMTTSMIESPVNVNLLGTMRVISAFLPEIRKIAIEGINKPKPRIINVGSHCGLQPLPAFAAYSASKAGLLALTRSLHLEHSDHGLAVIAFVPGGFVGTSNILASQGIKGDAMLEHLNYEQRAFYGQKITNLNNYLQLASGEGKFDSMKDPKILNTFMKAIWDENPKSMYKVESWRYMFYYTMMKIPLPTTLHKWIIKKFLSFPDC